MAIQLPDGLVKQVIMNGYIDLRKEENINRVVLNWETAYAKEFKIQVSNDAQTWKDVSVSSGKVGLQSIYFDDVSARYVRMLGMSRATGWGYSLWSFDVYGGDSKREGLSEVHFIRLRLKNNYGKLLSQNLYWRGNINGDFKALKALPKANLNSYTKVTHQDGKCFMTLKVANPKNAPSIAFAIRVKLVKASDGQQILPAFMNDNYFSLFPGETKNIQIEFDEKLLKVGDKPVLIIEPYND